MRNRSARITLGRRALAFFVPAAVLATALCGLVYVEVQQSLRSGANDPQYQMATDAAAQLDEGATSASVVGSGRVVDLATSLAPFVIVFDRNKSILATNATLDGTRPAPPHGVLDAARPSDPNVVTWQPRTGVRIATVTVTWTGGTVLAGRSLQQVEMRETNAEFIAGLFWLASLVALLAACVAAAWLWPATPPAAPPAN
jgi:hypothetical protein